MTKEELDSLQPGDIVRHKGDWKALVVTGNYGERVTAVRTYDLTNPTEWEVVPQRQHDPC